MVQVYRQQVEEALAASCHDCVARVIHVRPGIGALSQTAIGQLVQHALRETGWEEEGKREGGNKRGRRGRGDIRREREVF